MDKKFIIVIIIVLITLNAGYSKPRSRRIFIELIYNKRWLINMLFIIIFIIYIIYIIKSDKHHDNNIKLVESLEKAIIALIIGLFAELGLTIAPFWLIFALAYFMDW